MNIASIAAGLALTGLTTAAAAQPAPSPGEVRIALTDQRFALDRLAADQPKGSATFLVDDAPTIEVDLGATVDGLVTRIEAPSGAVVDAGHLPAGGDFGAFGPWSSGASDSPLISAFDGSYFHSVYRFPSAGPGTYRVVFEAPGLAAEAAVVTRFGTTSPVVAALFAPAPEVVLGNPVVLTAALFGGGQPVAGASVRVSVNDGAGHFTDITLRDDGVDPDTAAGDGLYSGELVPAAPGRYSAFATLGGNTAGGLPFNRQAATLFEVVRRTGILQGPFDDIGLDDNADGLIDRVRVRPALDVQEPGLYRLIATLRTASGKSLVRAGEATLPVGAGAIDVDFEATALLALGEDGPYEVAALDLYFIGVDSAVRADALTGVGLTHAYALRDLQRPALALTGRIEAQPLDDDGNGRFDRLRVSLEVDVKDAGTYTWGFKLADGSLAEIDFVSASGSLTAGLNAITVDFAGAKIGQHGVDGPFLLRDVLVYSETTSLVVAQAGQTPAYAFRQFEGATVPDVTPPTVTVTVSPAILTSPNHRLVPVTATVTVTDDQDPAPVVRLVSIVSSEADKGLGCGDLAGDIQGAELGTDDRSFQLRAEHGPMKGRVYTVTYEARDASGNSQRATAQVTVPRWR